MENALLSPGMSWEHAAESFIVPDMLNSIDHWDWKLDAPEFVPNVWALQGASEGAVPSAPARQSYGYQSDQALYIDRGAPQLKALHIDGGAAQLKAQFEWQMRAKDQQIQNLQDRLQQIEEEDAKIKNQWDQDRSHLLWQIDKHSEILKRSGIEIDEAIPKPKMLRSQLSWSSRGGEWTEPRQDTSTKVPRVTPASFARQEQPLESQMQRLNNLLTQNRSPSYPREGHNLPQHSDDHSLPGAPTLWQLLPGTTPPAVNLSDSDLQNSDESIVATLQSIFPHATVRASAENKVADTGSESVDDAKASADALFKLPTPVRELSPAGRFESPASVAELCEHDHLYNCDGSEPERTSSALGSEPWTASRFEKLAQQGGFSVREAGTPQATGGMSMDIIIWMCELDPMWGDKNMVGYCSWLRQRLQKLQKELGVHSLRHCRAEVDFSRNGLSDAAVGFLLEALLQSEIHVTILKLFANRIGSVGVQHLCSFVQKVGMPIHEVHLSHNEIEDTSALELIKGLVADGRYPPIRARDTGQSDDPYPVWIRLNNNRISDPKWVTRTAEAESGAWICQARNRYVCGPGRCEQRHGSQCPHVHLCAFNSQDAPQGKQWLPAATPVGGQQLRMILRPGAETGAPDRDSGDRLSPRPAGAQREKKPSQQASIVQQREKANAKPGPSPGVLTRPKILRRGELPVVGSENCEAPTMLDPSLADLS